MEVYAYIFNVLGVSSTQHQSSAALNQNVALAEHHTSPWVSQEI